MKKIRILIILTLLIAILLMSGLAMSATPVYASNANPLLTPTPTVTITVTPTPPTGGNTTTTISQIFNHLVFPAETISEALAGIFDKAADKEVRAMSEEVAGFQLFVAADAYDALQLHHTRQQTHAVTLV